MAASYVPGSGGLTPHRPRADSRHPSGLQRTNHRDHESPSRRTRANQTQRPRKLLRRERSSDPPNERVADPHLAFVHSDAEVPALEFDRKGADGWSLRITAVSSRCQAATTWSERPGLTHRRNGRCRSTVAQPLCETVGLTTQHACARRESAE